MHEDDLSKLGYKLIWQEEFEDSKISKSDWNIEEHRAGWINNELQAYVDDGKHVKIEDGRLYILPERIVNEDKTVTYRSGRVSTQGKHDFLYGYFEIKAKAARGKGLLTGLRLLPSTNEYGEWPRSGEIDIFNVDGQYPYKGLFNSHFGVPNTQRNCEFGYSNSDFASEYHVYGFEWLPGKMSFYLDGKLLYSNSYWFSVAKEGDEPSYPAPYDKPFNLEFDISIGGDWGGDPDRVTFYDNEAYAAIEYIRCYAKDKYDFDDVKMPVPVRSFKEPDSTGNYISSSRSDWIFKVCCSGQGDCSFGDGEYRIEPENAGEVDYSVQLLQGRIPLIKGKKYRLSFEAMASERRHMKVAVTAPDVHWMRYLDDTSIVVDKTWHTHIFNLDYNYEDDDNARVEFNLGNQRSTAAVTIRNVRFEQIDDHREARRAIAVCGAWEDAENYNLFLESLLTPEFTKDYVIMSFTFGIPTRDIDEDVTGTDFADYIDRFDLAAIIVFAAMIRSEEAVEKVRQIGLAKGIPVFFFEKEYEEVINVVTDYAGGFANVVSHVLDDHGCRRVKFFAGSPDNPFSIERENVFRRLMLSHGNSVTHEDILYGNFWDATAAQELNRKLDEGMELPEAFICANDSMAVGVCDCLRQRGIKVPEEVIVTGFDGTWLGRHHMPDISTASPDIASFGRYLLGVLDGSIPWKSRRHERIPVAYIEERRGSCGCNPLSGDRYDSVVNTLAHDNQDYFRHMLEMGKFITQTINNDDVDEASRDLQHFLWLWKDQYYFAALTSDDKNCFHSLLHGRDGSYRFREKYYNMKEPLPDYYELLMPGSGINILLFSQLRTKNAVYGYLCSGYKEIKLRDQQRFEEFGLYFSAMASSVLNNSQLLEANKAISSMSEMDYLTNLYNRRGFFRCVNEMLTDPRNKGRIFSLFSVDMDGLKYINDHFGHQEGDNAIIILANALQSYAGEKGVCARYGGDEFAMALVGDVNIADDYQKIRERIHNHAMNDPIVRDMGYSVNASIGIAECIITGYEKLDYLIHDADVRMYEDKQARKKGRS